MHSPLLSPRAIIIKIVFRVSPGLNPFFLPPVTREAKWYVLYMTFLPCPATHYMMYTLNACLIVLLQIGHLLGSLNSAEHRMQQTKWRQGMRIVSMSSLKQILHFLELSSRDSFPLARPSSSIVEGAMVFSETLSNTSSPLKQGKTPTFS